MKNSLNDKAAEVKNSTNEKTAGVKNSLNEKAAEVKNSTIEKSAEVKNSSNQESSTGQAAEAGWPVFIDSGKELPSEFKEGSWKCPFCEDFWTVRIKQHLESHSKKKEDVESSAQKLLKRKGNYLNRNERKTQRERRHWPNMNRSDHRTLRGKEKTHRERKRCPNMNRSELKIRREELKNL